MIGVIVLALVTVFNAVCIGILIVKDIKKGGNDNEDV